MAWEDDLQPCSYGGIRFHARVISGTQGRRIAVHRLLNAAPVSEDIGAASRTFAVQGYFVQNRENQDPYNDYLALRDLVLRGGVREFIHPHFPLTDNAQATTIVEEVRNRVGGFVSFTMQIDANSKTVFKPATPLTQTVLRDRNAQLRTSMRRLFGSIKVENFDPVTPIDFAADSPFTKFELPVSPIDQEGMFTTFGRFVDRVKNVRGALDAAGSAAFQRFRAPVNQLLDNYGDLASIVNDVDFIYQGFREAGQLNNPLDIIEFFINNPFSGINGNTGFHQRARDNDDAFTHLSVLSGLRAIGETLVENNLRELIPSRDEALRYSRRLLDVSNRELQNLRQGGAEDASQTLSNWLAALIEYEDEYLPQLSRVRIVTCPSRNALESTNRYNGDVAQIQRVVQENNILHIFDSPEQLNLRT